MEGFHNVGHLFFGGTMNNVACSPSDPVFWMHHANVDCLWEEFREAQQDSSNRTREYPLTNLGDNIAYLILVILQKFYYFIYQCNIILGVLLAK